MTKEEIIKQLEVARDRIQSQIDNLKSGKSVISGSRIIAAPCIHATRTGKKVKCKTCGGAEYIFCSIKQQKINENLCNSKCDNYMCGDE